MRKTWWVTIKWTQFWVKMARWAHSSWLPDRMIVTKHAKAHIQQHTWSLIRISPIRHQSVTCNRIISMSTGSRFRVLTHDQIDRHTKSMVHWSLWKVRDPVPGELRNHFGGELCIQCARYDMYSFKWNNEKCAAMCEIRVLSAFWWKSHTVALVFSSNQYRLQYNGV